MDVGGGGNHDPVNSGPQERLRTGSRLSPDSFDSRLDQCGHCVVDDERLDLAEFAEGGGVERADSAETDQTQSHGEPFSGVGLGRAGLCHVCTDELATRAARTESTRLLTCSGDRPYLVSMKSFPADSPQVSSMPMRSMRGDGPVDVRASATRPPRPPMTECSSTVTTR